jgi:hypothetical protein
MRQIITNLILGIVFVGLLYFIVYYVILKKHENFTQLEDINIYNSIVDFIENQPDHKLSFYKSILRRDKKRKIVIDIDDTKTEFNLMDFIEQNDRKYNIDGEQKLLIAFTKEMEHNIIETLRFITSIIDDILSNTKHSTQNSFSYCQYMIQTKQISFSKYTFKTQGVNIIKYDIDELIEESHEFLNAPYKKEKEKKRKKTEKERMKKEAEELENPPDVIGKSGINKTAVKSNIKNLNAAGKAFKDKTDIANSDTKQGMNDEIASKTTTPPPTTPPPTTPPPTTPPPTKSPTHGMNWMQKIVYNKKHGRKLDSFVGSIRNTNVINYNDIAMKFIKKYINIPNKILRENPINGKNIIEDIFLLNESDFNKLIKLIHIQ